VYPTAALRNGFLGRNILKDLGTLFPSSASLEQWLESSPELQGSWWPDWVSWLTQRSGTQKKTRPAGSAKYPQLDPAPGRYVLQK
jgi:polyhydroxyalkanoate synthase subunit PhaC